MSDPPADFLTILTVLARHKVAFVIIGGVGAVLKGRR